MRMLQAGRARRAWAQTPSSDLRVAGRVGETKMAMRHERRGCRWPVSGGRIGGVHTVHTHTERLRRISAL
jgi:hypothetical protein